MKLPLGDLNPGPCPLHPQVLILVEWPSHQGCTMVNFIYIGVKKIKDVYLFNSVWMRSE